MDSERGILILVNWLPYTEAAPENPTSEFVEFWPVFAIVNRAVLTILRFIICFDCFADLFTSQPVITCILIYIYEFYSNHQI